MTTATNTTENYLKAIFHLSYQKDRVGISDIAARLGVSKPSTSSMIKRLSEQGLVNYEKYQPISLTEEGRFTAAMIIRKHRLTEMYLVEKMGFGWEEVHDIAEQIEHVKAPMFFNKMDELLGFPKVDPHGSPIPDREGNIIWTQYMPLAEGEPNIVYEVKALGSEQVEFLRVLNELDIVLGSKVEVIRVHEFDGSVEVKFNSQKHHTLSLKVSRLLLVK